MRFLIPALFAVAPAVAGADPEQLIDAVVAAHPKRAIGLAWSVGGAAPELLVRGPAHRGGPSVAPDARWHIGSITKSVTVALAMNMAEAGEIDLDTPIRTYLDGLPEAWGNLTLKPLFSHTAGVPVAFPAPVMKGETTGDGPADRLARLRPIFEAGPPEDPAFAYSNAGYVLAGLVLETVAGRPWEDLVQERILLPAGITSAGFGAPKGAGDPWGHRKAWGITRPVDPQRRDSDNPPWLGPAGTLHMSLRDLHRWAEVLRRACAGEPAPISEASCAEMIVPVAGDYAMGLTTQTMGSGARFIWHNGSNSQWYAITGFSPEHGISIAVTLNHFDGPLADQLLRDVMRYLVGEP